MSAARPPRRLALVLTVGLSFAACAEARTEPGLEELPVATAEREVRIGSIDDPDYAFGTVSDVAVGPDGDIYSLHSQENLIRRWTAEGVAAGTIGRTGEGPGEYTSPRSLGWRGDSLWVFDTRMYRVSFFDRAGTFLSALSPRVDLGSGTTRSDGGYPARPEALLADGNVLAVTPGFSNDIVSGSLTELAYVRTDPSGAVLDTLTMLPVGPTNVLGVLRENGGTFTSQPFGDSQLAELAHDGSGLLLLDRPAAITPAPSEFRLTRLDLNGDTVYSRAYAYDPVALPRERVDSAVEAMGSMLFGFMGERTGTTRSQWEGWVTEAMYVPPFYAPVESVLPGRDGTIWLELSPAVAGEPEWLVLEEDGSPLARVDAPDGLRILLADRSTLWGVETDELDVPYIVRYRLVIPSP